MFLLIFATAVTSIATEFGVGRWEDLMPYSVAAFFCFGIGSVPAGRLGDLWGRRPMMIIFFIGIGLAAVLVSLTQTPLQMALTLALLGCFASIYHPVGIPMLVQGAERPGWVIGVNGLAGNLGVAGAALVTGLLVKHVGWRAAFWVPGVISIACGLLFALTVAPEAHSPARKPARAPDPARASARASGGVTMARLFIIMTMASTSGSLLFNFSTNSNFELLTDRLQSIAQDPAQIGLLLAGVYFAASLTQLWVGHLLDRVALKWLYLGIIAAQGVFLVLATHLTGWGFYGVQFLFMAAIFGAIPFTDAIIVRFVDDASRSRVTGMRLAVSFGASSCAVWLLGPVVKQAGFTALLWLMAAISLMTFAIVSQLPRPSPQALVDATTGRRSRPAHG